MSCIIMSCVIYVWWAQHIKCLVGISTAWSLFVELGISPELAEKVRAAYASLHQNMRAKEVIPHMFSNKALSDEDMDYLEGCTSERDMNDHILRKVIMRGKQESFYELKQALLDTNQPHLHRLLDDDDDEAYDDAQCDIVEVSTDPQLPYDQLATTPTPTTSGTFQAKDTSNNEFRERSDNHDILPSLPPPEPARKQQKNARRWTWSSSLQVVRTTTAEIDWLSPSQKWHRCIGQCIDRDCIDHMNMRDHIEENGLTRQSIDIMSIL